MQPQNAPSVRWEWIGEAWNLFTSQWSVWVLMILVMYLVVFAVYLPFIGVIGMMMPTPDMGEPVEFPVGIVALYPVIYLALFSVLSWLMGGLYNAAFKQLRGEPISVGDLFSGGPYFARMLGALVLIAIGSGIGSIFCIIPGLIVYGLTFLTFPMIVEGGKGTIDAIKESIEITKRDWIMFTLFAVALYFIASAGVLACGVGVLATMPLLFLGNALAYRDLVGMRGAQRQGQFIPPPPPPDYRSYTPSQMSTPQAPPQFETPYRPEQPPRPEPTYRPGPPPQPPQSESTTTTCPHCGAALNRAANFCNQCGNRLGNA
ncbi:MAG: hypothetical protein AB7U82_15235 [Blastocatellales bacterium]